MKNWKGHWILNKLEKESLIRFQLEYSFFARKFCTIGSHRGCVKIETKQMQSLIITIQLINYHSLKAFVWIKINSACVRFYHSKNTVFHAFQIFVPFLILVQICSWTPQTSKIGLRGFSSTLSVFFGIKIPPLPP